MFIMFRGHSQSPGIQDREVPITARMSEQSMITNVLGRYPGVVPRKLEPLGGAGGYSGAAFWRIETSDARLCLRRWPREHPGAAQLQWIHGVLCHAEENGFVKLPIPLRSRNGQTFVSAAGHLWEVTAWLPGRADFHDRPTSHRLDAALVALAQFHRACESFESRSGTPPGIASRRKQLEQLCAGEEQPARHLSQIRGALHRLDGLTR